MRRKNSSKNKVLYEIPLNSYTFDKAPIVIMTEQLLEAKKAYKDKDYEMAYELFTNLYGKIPFDNLSKYSYAWSVYHTKVKDFTSKKTC